MDSSRCPSHNPATKSRLQALGGMMLLLLAALGLFLVVASLYPLRLAFITLSQDLAARSSPELAATMQLHDVSGLTFFQMLCTTIVFGGLGGLLFWFSIACIRRQRVERALRERYPSEPWRWEPAWAEGRIRCNTHEILAQYLLFTMIWNGMSWVIFLAGLKKIRSEHYAPEFIALIVFFPLIGVLLICQTFFIWRSWHQLRAAELKLATLPGVIGGLLSGTLHLPCHRTSVSAVKLTLRCVKTSMSQDRRSASRKSQDVLWDAMSQVDPGALPFRDDGLDIPVLFQIPFRCKPTASEPRISWEIELEVNFGSSSATAAFPVPVFKTPASNPAFQPNPALVSGIIHAPTPEEMMKAAGVKILPLPGGGRRYQFDANRRLAVLFFPTFFTIPFAGLFTCVMFSMGIPVFFHLLLVLVLTLTLWSLFDLWFWSGRVDVTPQGVVRAGGIFFKSRQVHIPFGEIQRFSLTGCTTICDRQFFDLELETTHGTQVKLGKRLATRDVGEWLIHEIERDLLTDASVMKECKVPDLSS